MEFELISSLHVAAYMKEELKELAHELALEEENEIESQEERCWTVDMESRFALGQPCCIVMLLYRWFFRSEDMKPKRGASTTYT